MEGVSPLEVARLVLYAVEWIISIIVWGTTADKLTSFGVGTVKACYFGNGSNCGAIMFFGVVATLILTGLIIAHCTSQLPRAIETYAFVGFAVVWALVAIISSATAPSRGKTSAGNAVAFFSWASVVASLASGGIAFYEVRQGEEELNHDLKI
jgi:MFS family permease